MKHELDELNFSLNNKNGSPRKVGLELEFAGLELEEAARMIQGLYGGKIEKGNRYQYHISSTRLGDFVVELDARILKKMEATDFFKKWGLDIDEQKIKESIGDVLDKLAKTVIPLEIIMPPVPYTDLEKLEHLRKKLQEQRAEGAESSWMYAFGMHINIDAPDLEAGTIVNYLKAFFILYPWLVKKSDIDFARRVSPFIDHFPDEYIRLILNPDYRPLKEQLIDDYLVYNPTRNRPLDMMPIWAVIDERRIEQQVKGEKNKPRPAFHYRLPNSRIDDADWTFTSEWELWLHVERLAMSDEMLRKLSRLYLLREGETFISFRKEWAQTVAILLGLDESRR